MVISADAHPDFSVVSRNDLPLVLLDRVIGNSVYPSVSVDNRAGAYEAVRHLLGHQRAAVDYIAGAGESPAALDRENGWRPAQEHARVQPGRIERPPFSRRGGHDATRRLLDGDQLPTAIFATSDVQAVGALRACRDSGLHIPHDIAIVAFDGTEEAEFTAPPLSVVAQPIVEIAETAVRILAEEPDRTGRYVTHWLTHSSPGFPADADRLGDESLDPPDRWVGQGNDNQVAGRTVRASTLHVNATFPISLEN